MTPANWDGVPEMSLVTRRRAIYTGLAKYLPEAELMPILSFWEANYAGKAGLCT